MSDSDSSDVDFDIEVPEGTHPPIKRHGKQKIQQQKLINKKSKPLANHNEDDNSPPAFKNGNKRSSDPAWDEDSDSDSDQNSRTSILRRSSTTENQPPIYGGRPKAKRINFQGSDEDESNDDSDDEPERTMESGKQIGLTRARKRLSIRQHETSKVGSTISVASSLRDGNIPLPDANTLKTIYSTCIELFQTHKITLENAFQLRFLDLMRDIIRLPDFDKFDMHGAGRMLEAGAKIYVCRVDKTKHSVMDLASTLNLQQKKKKRDDADNDNENDVHNEDDSMAEDEVQSKSNKRKKKVKGDRNQFICENISKISIATEDDGGSGGSRRTALKKKFNDLLDNDFDFDYHTFIFKSVKNLPEPEPENNSESSAETAKFIVSDAVCNFDGILNLGHLPFILLPEFVKKEHNIWGLPLSTSADQKEGLNNSVPEPENPELPIAGNEEMLYVPPPVDEQPAEYGPQEDDQDVGNVTFVNEDGDEVDPEIEKRAGNPRKIADLQEFFDMYSKIKSKYGWCGPSFVRPQLNLLKPNGNLPRKPRLKKDPIFPEFKKADWQNHVNKYKTINPEKTVFDERTIEKWSLGGKNVQPYIGIEDTDENDHMFDIEIQQQPDIRNENFIPNIFRYFIDPRRNLLEEMQKVLKDEEKEYPQEFDKEEEEYIQDAGFDIEHHRDDDFADLPLDGQNADDPIIADLNTPFEASMAFPTSLGGLWMDSDKDPLSKASEIDSLRFTKKPKPIDMHALKRAILDFLQDKLLLQATGEPSQDEETKSNLAALIKEVCQKVDKKMAEHLSISIISVGLLHVVVDKKLFMIVNAEETANPLIVCRGKLWIHADNIPFSDFNTLEQEMTSTSRR